MKSKKVILTKIEEFEKNKEDTFDEMGRIIIDAKINSLKWVLGNSDEDKPRELKGSTWGIKVDKSKATKHLKLRTGNKSLSTPPWIGKRLFK